MIGTHLPPSGSLAAGGGFGPAPGSGAPSLVVEAPLASGSGFLPLVVDATGGSPALVAVVFGLLAVASVLSVAVTYRFARGYLRTGTRPLLLLACGLFFLAPAPIFARLVFANALATPDAYRILTTSGSELFGLLLVLYTIYR